MNLPSAASRFAARRLPALALASLALAPLPAGAQFSLDNLLNRAAQEAQRALQTQKPPEKKEETRSPATSGGTPAAGAAAPAGVPAAAAPVASAPGPGSIPKNAPRWEAELTYRATRSGDLPPKELAGVFSRQRPRDEWSATLRFEFSRVDRSALTNSAPDPRNPARWYGGYLFRGKAQATMTAWQEAFRYEPQYALDGLGETLARIGWHWTAGGDTAMPGMASEAQFQFDRTTGDFSFRPPEVCIENVPVGVRVIALPPVPKAAAKVVTGDSFRRVTGSRDAMYRKAPWYCLAADVADVKKTFNGRVAPDAIEVPLSMTLVIPEAVTGERVPGTTLEMTGVLRRIAE